MRKGISLLICAVLTIVLAFAFVGCVDGKKDVVVVREDTRGVAYVAYNADDQEIGRYKSLAFAAEAAIADGINSYVTKVDSSVKMFRNKEGYMKGENDECFWYYENGVSLDSFNCWEIPGTMDQLYSSDFLTLHTQGYGTSGTQTYNSYSVLDKTGQEVTDINVQSWHLSTTLDSAVMAFPKIENGMTTLEYDIDLSEVKITPAYTTGDEKSTVYAFLGFYMWQDYYVVRTGIACDVSTGKWYAYEGTSRDDSASDTEYNMGKCLMTSTYDASKGYFVPDCNSVKLTIETKLLEEDGEEYQGNVFTAKFSDNSIYSKTYDDGDINKFFGATANMSWENVYVFTAGLDVVNDIAKDKDGIPVGVDTINTDYFNGAKFENIKVTNAEAYVPTIEEMSDTRYGSIITPGDRGKKHNMKLATGGGNLVDFTVFNTSLCGTYKKDGNNDVYSFDNELSAYNPVTTNALGTAVKGYQDQIDELAAVTAANATSYLDKIQAVGLLYGNGSSDNSTIEGKYWNVLDFVDYITAKAIAGV